MCCAEIWPEEWPSNTFTFQSMNQVIWKRQELVIIAWNTLPATHTRPLALQHCSLCIHPLKCDVPSTCNHHTKTHFTCLVEKWLVTRKTNRVRAVIHSGGLKMYCAEEILVFIHQTSLTGFCKINIFLWAIKMLCSLICQMYSKWHSSESSKSTLV